MTTWSVQTTSSSTWTNIPETARGYIETEDNLFVLATENICPSPWIRCQASRGGPSLSMLKRTPSNDRPEEQQRSEHKHSALKQAHLARHEALSTKIAKAQLFFSSSCSKVAETRSFISQSKSLRWYQ